MLKLPFDLMVTDLGDYETRIILAARNSRNGCLRATKPFKRIDFDGENALFEACANYVWRMLCYDFCNCRPHNCMPVTADWDICAVYYRRKDRLATLRSTESPRADRDTMDALIKRAESVMPITAQKGVMAAARAFGLI